MASRKYWPIWQLTLARLKEFLRQPAAIFWVYGFPILMMMSLGIAFRDDVSEEIAVDVIGAESFVPNVARQLEADNRFRVTTEPAEEWRKRLQAGKTDLVVEVVEESKFRLWDEPHRAESRLARYAVELR